MNRPVVIIGGWLSNPGDYAGMARTIAGPPFNRMVYICDIRRRTWFEVRDPDFRPVLDILAATVKIAMQETAAEQVDLIGHSAGGRIARAYLGEAAIDGRIYNGQRYVASYTSLGTAHATAEIWVAGFAALIDQRYPGAFYPQIAYRSVAGRSVQGQRIGTPEEMFAYRSYSVAFGNGSLVGDGVIPEQACYLAGADNLVLVGVRHSPYNAPGNWYGAPAVVPLWFEP